MVKVVGFWLVLAQDSPLSDGKYHLYTESLVSIINDQQFLTPKSGHEDGTGTVKDYLFLFW
jgi:hypothetical protein